MAAAGAGAPGAVPWLDLGGAPDAPQSGSAGAPRREAPTPTARALARLPTASSGARACARCPDARCCPSLARRQVLTAAGLHGMRDSSAPAGTGGAAAHPGAPGGSLARALARAALQGGARAGGAPAKAPAGDAEAVRAAAVRLLAALRCCDATSTIGAPERERAGSARGVHLSRCCQGLLLPGPLEGWRTAPTSRLIWRQDRFDSVSVLLPCGTLHRQSAILYSCHTKQPPTAPRGGGAGELSAATPCTT